MAIDYVVKIEERFYVGEHGFKFSVKTGLNMTELASGDIRSVLKRPSGSVVKRIIPLTDVIATSSGTVYMSIEEDDLSAAGTYEAQIFIRDPIFGTARPSHVFSFVVSEPVLPNFEDMFV